MGDLNMPPAAAGPLSGWQVLVRDRTYPSPDPRVQLDHVLAHGDLPAVRSAGRGELDVSDHRPLVVELSAASVVRVETRVARGDDTAAALEAWRASLAATGARPSAARTAEAQQRSPRGTLARGGGAGR